MLLSQLGIFRHSYKTYRQDPNDCRSVYTRAGRVIGEGTNSVSSQPYQFKSYRLEEVVLPGLITCEVRAPVRGGTGELQNQTFTFDKVWRLIITSERKLAVTEGPYWIYLDKEIVGVGTVSADGSGLITIIRDQTLLREGATIGMRYVIRAIEPEIVLPETLHLNTSP